MICQIASFCKTLSERIWKISLKELNFRYIQAIWIRAVALCIAESGKPISPADYICYGTYGRKPILDVQLVVSPDGSVRYEEVLVVDLRIQRIQEKETGATQALLNDILVPYGNFSLRYILFHLHQYFGLEMSIETYCVGKDFDERTFKVWIVWMKQHITILRELGLTQDSKENKQIMKQWVDEIMKDLCESAEKSLRLLKLGLYQRHPMPDHSSRQMIEPGG